MLELLASVLSIYVFPGLLKDFCAVLAYCLLVDNSLYLGSGGEDGNGLRQVFAFILLFRLFIIIIITQMVRVVSSWLLENSHPLHDRVLNSG